MSKWDIVFRQTGISQELPILPPTRAIGASAIQAATRSADATGGGRAGPAARAACLALPLLTAGCGIYLHDPELAKSTAKLAEDSKAATTATLAALKSERDAFAAHAKEEIKAVTENERSQRHLAIAGLMLSDHSWTDIRLDALAHALERETDSMKRTTITNEMNELRSGAKSFTERLKRQIASRQHDLVGEKAGTQFSLQYPSWSESTLKQERARASLSRSTSSLRLAIASYEAVHKVKFAGCGKLPAKPAAGSTDAKTITITTLYAACVQAAKDEQQLTKLQQARDVLLANAKHGSRLARVKAKRDTAQMQLSDVKKAKAEADAALAQLQNEIDLLKAKPDAKAQLHQKFGELDKFLSDADRIVGSTTGLAGQPTSLGTALAAVDFRETNLRDVLAALAQPAKEGSDEAKKKEQILARQFVGLVAGLQTLVEATSENPKTPSLAELTVAFAHQEGLARARRAELTALEQRLHLLELRLEALVQEYMLLTQAKHAVDGLTAKVPSDCNPADLADLVAKCTDDSARRSAARAVLSYGYAITVGQMGDKLADTRDTQILRERILRVAEENAGARLKIIATATEEMAAYGAGGIKAETIAAFLQAIGLGFIAVGVN